MQVEGESVFQPTREVDAIEWLSPAAAYERLNYVSERGLLAELFPHEL